MSDEILTYIKDTVTRIETKQDKQSDRINDVEKWQARAEGKMSIIAAACTAIGGGIVAAINYLKNQS